MSKAKQEYPGPNIQYLNIQGYIVSKLKQPASDYYDIQINSCSPISIDRDIVAQKE